MPISDEDPSKLVQAAGLGDEAAFSALFIRYYERIRAFAWRIVFDSQSAEDIAQEAFIRVARQIHTLRDERTFEGWLFRIAANLSRDHLRSRISHEKKIVAAGMASPARTETDSHRIELALQSLPHPQREAVALVFYEGCSHAEASRRIGCAEATVSWRIMLAKRRLKKILKP